MLDKMHLAKDILDKSGKYVQSVTVGSHCHRDDSLGYTFVDKFCFTALHVHFKP